MFSLRFKKHKILYWANKYSYENEDVVCDLISPVKKRGHLTYNEFLSICRWKTPRSQKKCQENEESYVKLITKSAFKSRNERFKIETLTLLKGVSWPTASTILHFFDKGKYPILDFRALWSLKKEVPNQYTFEFWIECVEYCRKLSKECGVNMRILDRALWQYSKERQK